MEAVYLDLHIHTSEDPHSLNANYDLEELVSKIKTNAAASEFLISLTDHNTINKHAYLRAKSLGINIILGCELHIEYSSEKHPYHCHIYFNTGITELAIDDINAKLDSLYPKKVINPGDRVPHIDSVIQAFDEYDFLLLPHGGQSHKTFDGAVPDGLKFDSVMERSVYYNQFDGFTARSNKGLERTQRYFTRLGINEFVNLVTCTDNYNPKDYPNAKADEAQPFIPTWMFARPNFSGLRLSLSESSRLTYGDRPTKWAEFIAGAKLENDNISIDIRLTPGLNVVIGGSSSGKTLLVDSIFKKALNNFEGSKYLELGVEDIHIDNIAGILPHYINQNYIIELITESSGKSIAEIPIIKNIFPGDQEIGRRVRLELSHLKNDLHELLESVQSFEKASIELQRIPIISRLILNKSPEINIISSLTPSSDDLEKVEFPKSEHSRFFEYIQDLETFYKKNAFIEYNQSTFDQLRRDLDTALSTSEYEASIRKIIKRHKDNVDSSRRAQDSELQAKIQNRESLITQIKIFALSYKKFNSIISKISSYSITCETQKIESSGHQLFIDNSFKLSRDVVIDAFNKYLKSGAKITSIEEITPQSLFEDNFSKKSPKVTGYDDFESRVYSDLEAMNKRTYRIISNNGKKFEELSAGWKTSILLDLILGYQGDTVPLIIDQPEDNLATDYINHGLIKAIKAVKSYKQIILVSHNATIPMLGDAQNVIVCKNNGKIQIKSDALEGEIEGQSVVDLIAEITDGGKPSIKKRVKKYNLKQFRETT